MVMAYDPPQMAAAFPPHFIVQPVDDLRAVMSTELEHLHSRVYSVPACV